MPSRLNLVATSRSQSGSALSRKAIERSTPDVGFREPDVYSGRHACLALVDYPALEPEDRLPLADV